MRSRKAFYNIISNLLLQFTIVVYGFIVPKIIIEYFGSNVNGLIASITQFLGYITLLESGFGPVVKSCLYKPISNKNDDEIANIIKNSENFFRRISYIFIVYIVILCFIFPYFVSSNFDNIFTVSLIIIISLSTFAEYYFGMTYRLYLQANQDNYVISIIQIFTYLLSVIIIVVLALNGFSIQLIKFFSGLVFILRPLVQNYYVKKKFKIDFSHVDENYSIENKWDGLAQHVASVIHGNTDITILTFLSTLSEVSVYSVYYLVVAGIRKIIQVFSSSIDSTFGDMLACNEKHNLTKKFNMYEVIYNTITTIVFTSTMVLIVPFVKVYTKGISDANYIRYLFGYLLVISEFLWAIRLPYSSITLAAGHFKETRVGAWVECLSNIIVSVLLVFKYGIIGVAIGTIVAMFIRTFEFVYHTNKYILTRSIWLSLNKIMIVLLESFIIVFICNMIPYFGNVSYISWILNAIIVTFVSSIITLGLNFILFRKDFVEFGKILKNVIFRKKRS